MRRQRWTVALILLGILLIPVVHNHQVFGDRGDRFSATKSGCVACLLDSRSATVSVAQSLTIPHSFAELACPGDALPTSSVADSASSRGPPAL